MKLTSMKVQALCIFVLILVVGTSSQHVNCPFDYIYHFGDTTTDIGNAILIDPNLAAAYLPFGITNPGFPTGRWCDGYIDFDFESRAYNLSNIVPYLGLNGSTKYDGVMFSVAWSPVLDRPFFESRGIEIPLYCVSLNGQLQWFKEHINNIAPTSEAVAERLQQSIFFTGDLEANDLVYGLTQGKSIEEVKTYVPYIVEALLNFLRELIAMGASRIVVPGNFPIGCTPYILTELGTDDPKDYDDIGCLHTVNELIQYKNQAVEDAINKEFPNTVVSYADNYGVVYSYINTTFNGPHGNITLQACCGVGGKYNFDSKRFCGHPEATVCSNPNDSVWWDGMHHTEGTYNNILSNLINASLASVNCTISPQLSASAQLSASI